MNKTTAPENHLKRYRLSIECNQRQLANKARNRLQWVVTSGGVVQGWRDSKALSEMDFTHRGEPLQIEEKEKRD